MWLSTKRETNNEQPSRFSKATHICEHPRVGKKRVFRNLAAHLPFKESSLRAVVEFVPARDLCRPKCSQHQVLRLYKINMLYDVAGLIKGQENCRVLSEYGGCISFSAQVT